MGEIITTISPEQTVSIANGEHLFWFPKTSSSLGRCKRCKLIVTRKEAEKRQFTVCKPTEGTE